MPTRTKTSPARALKPPQTSIERVRAAGLRLRGALNPILLALPGSPAKGTELARLLRLDGFLCRKILAGAREADGLATAAKLPGVEGLQQFALAVRRSLRDGLLATELDDAIADFHTCTKQVAGSQTELLAMISAEIPERREKAHERTRAGLFRYARELTGRSCHVHLSLVAFRTNPDDPGVLDFANARGLIGLERLRYAVPITFGVTRSSPPSLAPPEEDLVYCSLEGEELDGFVPGALLQPFSSPSLPPIESHRTRTGVVRILDLNGQAVKVPIDILTAARCARMAPHPSREPQPVLSVTTTTEVPAKHLLFDVYLDRSLATMCVASLATYFLGMRGAIEDRDERWFDRFPPIGQLQHLGPGIASCQTPVYPRYAHLTRYFFESLGWDPEGFVGFRCALGYPPWAFQICMHFDFPAAAGPRRSTRS